jgi:hypothetical protein
VSADEVRARSLLVVDDEDRPRVVLGRVDPLMDVWGLLVLGVDGKPCVLAAGGVGESFVSVQHDQRDAMSMRATDGDGSVTVVDRDSSGFGTRRTVSWFSKKHGRPMQAREWVKLHLVVGVRTHVVTAVEVPGWSANDAPYLSSLLTGTARHFDVREVSADKDYLTKRNVDAIERAGAAPFIPFKSNTVTPTDDSAWSRMWHLYSFNRARFLDHYHRRSNVEPAFAMIKAKFGDDMSGKSDTAQVNEVLCKVIARNLCVLIQSFYELGVNPTFASPAA